MGADKPLIQKPESKTPILFYFLLVGAVLMFLVLFKSEILDKRGLEPTLSPKEAAKLQKRLREIDESEQYALIAIEDGWYTCLHSGRTSYYLNEGEVWKFGVTSKGEFGRYSPVFLSKNRVAYFVQFKGSFSDCLNQEQIKLFNYPYSPENLARPLIERLPRPPYNSIRR